MKKSQNGVMCSNLNKMLEYRSLFNALLVRVLADMYLPDVCPNVYLPGLGTFYVLPCNHKLWVDTE